MNVDTITCDPEVAREKLREYRKGLHRKADAEWQEAATVYEALAKGTPVISLAQALHGAPRDEKRRPMLAIARADRREVTFSEQWWGNPNWTFDSRGVRGRDGNGLRITLPGAGGERCQATGFALVPMVPPVVKGNRDLAKHFILWEVERWADRSQLARPDRDPYLLSRLSEDLFAVVGAWDLTDVERLVMRGRATT